MISMHLVEQPDAPETTYKTREVEGILDLYFYRRIGYWLAQVFARLKPGYTAQSAGESGANVVLRLVERNDTGPPGNDEEERRHRRRATGESQRFRALGSI